MVHTFSFDPGETTGWCHLSVFEDEIGLFDCGEGDHLQIGNMLYDNQCLKNALGRPEIEVVFIAEKFMMNSKVTPSPWSLETIGLIRYFASRYHIPFHLVAPSAHKNLIGSDAIKRAGLWVPGKGHAMDAVSIALYHLITKKGLLRECLVP